MKVFRFLPALMMPVLLASCKNTKKSGYEDPYAANFATDGGYNPYPSGGGGGYETPAPPVSEPAYTAPSKPTYEAPPVADNYAYTAPSKPAPSTPTPKPKTSSSSSSTVKKKPTTTAAKKSSSSKTHTVSKGDTLYGLARKYGTTVAKIKSANGMSSDLIRLGQKVKIP
jgi:LysM repeat protein